MELESTPPSDTKHPVVGALSFHFVTEMRLEQNTLPFHMKEHPIDSQSQASNFLRVNGLQSLDKFVKRFAYRSEHRQDRFPSKIERQMARIARLSQKIGTFCQPLGYQH